MTDRPTARQVFAFVALLALVFTASFALTWLGLRVAWGPKTSKSPGISTGSGPSDPQGTRITLMSFVFGLGRDGPGKAFAPPPGTCQHTRLGGGRLGSR